MRRTTCAALAFAAASAFAQHHVEYGINLSLGNAYHEEYLQGEQPSGPIHNILNEDGYGYVEGWANVGFGVNKARLDIAGTNADNPFFFEYGFATSRYWDVILFDDPELNGTPGSFETTLYLEGVGNFDTTGGLVTSPSTEIEAFWHAVINVMVGSDPWQSAFYAGLWTKYMGETEVTYSGDPLNSYQSEHTFQFIYGEPFLLDTFLQTDIYVDNQAEHVRGTFAASIDLGNSSYWGGIRNLRDANGNPVTGAGYSSSSGFDYRQSSVPEPATIAVLALGALSLLRRRRGKTRA